MVDEIRHSDIPVWFQGTQRWMTGLTKRTTCDDVIYALLVSCGLHESHSTDSFAIFEKWREVERPLSSRTKICKVWSIWGEEQTSVQLTMRSLDDYFLPGESSLYMRSRRRHRKSGRNNRDRHTASCKTCSVQPEERTRVQTLEQLVKLVVGQERRIQELNLRISSTDRDIEQHEARIHLHRVEQNGQNYLLNSYLHCHSSQSSSSSSSTGDFTFSSLDPRELKVIFREASSQELAEIARFCENLIQLERQLWQEQAQIRELANEIEALSGNTSEGESDCNDLLENIRVEMIRAVTLYVTNEYNERELDRRLDICQGEIESREQRLLELQQGETEIREQRLLESQQVINQSWNQPSATSSQNHVGRHAHPSRKESTPPHQTVASVDSDCNYTKSSGNLIKENADVTRTLESEQSFKPHPASKLHKEFNYQGKVQFNKSDLGDNAPFAVSSKRSNNVILSSAQAPIPREKQFKQQNKSVTRDVTLLHSNLRHVRPVNKTNNIQTQRLNGRSKSAERPNRVQNGVQFPFSTSATNSQLHTNTPYCYTATSDQYSYKALVDQYGLEVSTSANTDYSRTNSTKTKHSTQSHLLLNNPTEVNGHLGQESNPPSQANQWHCRDPNWQVHDSTIKNNPYMHNQVPYHSTNMSPIREVTFHDLKYAGILKGRENHSKSPKVSDFNCRVSLNCQEAADTETIIPLNKAGNAERNTDRRADYQTKQAEMFKFQQVKSTSVTSSEPVRGGNTPPQAKSQLGSLSLQATFPSGQTPSQSNHRSTHPTLPSTFISSALSTIYAKNSLSQQTYTDDRITTSPHLVKSLPKTDIEVSKSSPRYSAMPSTMTPVICSTRISTSHVSPISYANDISVSSSRKNLPCSSYTSEETETTRGALYHIVSSKYNKLQSCSPNLTQGEDIKSLEQLPDSRLPSYEQNSTNDKTFSSQFIEENSKKETKNLTFSGFPNEHHQNSSIPVSSIRLPAFLDTGESTLYNEKPNHNPQISNSRKDLFSHNDYFSKTTTNGKHPTTSQNPCNSNQKNPLYNSKAVTSLQIPNLSHEYNSHNQNPNTSTGSPFTNSDPRFTKINAAKVPATATDHIKSSPNSNTTQRHIHYVPTYIKPTLDNLHHAKTRTGYTINGGASDNPRILREYTQNVNFRGNNGATTVTGESSAPYHYTATRHVNGVRQTGQAEDNNDSNSDTGLSSMHSDDNLNNTETLV